MVAPKSRKLNAFVCVDITRRPEKVLHSLEKGPPRETHIPTLNNGEGEVGRGET